MEGDWQDGGYEWNYPGRRTLRDYGPGRVAAHPGADYQTYSRDSVTGRGEGSAVESNCGARGSGHHSCSRAEDAALHDTRGGAGSVARRHRYPIAYAPASYAARSGTVPAGDQR